MIKLSRERWKEYDMGELVSHLSSSESDKKKRDSALHVGVEHLKTLDLKLLKPNVEDKTSFSKVFKSGNILFARRAAYLKKVALADFDGICSGDLMVLQSKGELSQHLLAFMMQRDSFYRFVLSNSAGSLSLRIKWNSLSKYKIKLPPKEEQERILKLLTNIDDLIYKSQEQALLLKQKKQKILNNFLHNDEFGANLEKEKWETFEYGELVNHIEEKEKNLANRSTAKYVGVKHIDTLDTRIKGVFDEEMPTYFRKFKKGQILFAKRRAYQKKVAIASFDGICSPHLWALESINEKLLQDFLPFLMQSDVFYDYVNKHSAGTMSTYLKWEALSKYKINLPPIRIQHSLVNLFNNFNHLTYTYENQLESLKNLKLKLLTEIFD